MQCDSTASVPKMKNNDDSEKQPATREDLEREVFDLRQLLEISKSLNSTLEYHDLIDAILHICVGQIQVLRTGIFTRKEIGCDDLVLHRNYIGFDVDHTIEYRIGAGEPLYRFMSEHPHCFTPQDLERTVGLPHSVTRLEPELLVPVQAKGELHGVLVLAERIEGTPFTAKEQDYLLAVAMFAGIAISNSVLFERSHTDMMTRLKLRHSLESSITEIRNQEHRHPFSLVLLDIDHFKTVNDTYGHNVGDQVLKTVAEAIRNSVRQNDVAARYGGEEFAVLLPESDEATAWEIAERIRKSVAGQITQYEGTRISVTISAGIAEFDVERDITISDFVKRADTALYRSKQLGRNRTTAAE